MRRRPGHGAKFELLASLTQVIAIHVAIDFNAASGENGPCRCPAIRYYGTRRKCFDAVQCGDWDAYAATIRRSWELNRRLDTSTNPPEVAGIVARVAPYAAALKLAGAGGGGFLYILCHDAAAAGKLRVDLQRSPPNPRARFFDMTISPTGLRVTRS